jgi:hypothetical protein
LDSTSFDYARLSITLMFHLYLEITTLLNLEVTEARKQLVVNA